MEGVAGIRAAITSYQGRTARGGPYPTQLLEIKTVLALNLARNSRLANLDPALSNGRLKSKFEFEKSQHTTQRASHTNTNGRLKVRSVRKGMKG